MIPNIIAIPLLISAFTIDETSVVSVCGFQFTEGPVWVKGIGWIFSDIPANKIFTLNKNEFMSNSGNSNGLAIDSEGNIFVAEHRNRCVSLLRAKDQKREVLADNFEGKKFNSPNDLVLNSKGELYFTDPPYGLPGGLNGTNSELGFCGIFKLDKDRKVRLLSKNLLKPNGIALSRDEKTLFVADTEQNAVFIFNLEKENEELNEELFVKVPHPDGIKVDKEENLWVTSSEGLLVFDRNGSEIYCLPLPKQPSNCAFGGDNGDELLVTARECVYLYRVKW